MRVWINLLGGILVILLLAAGAVRLRYGGGETGFEDRTGLPRLEPSALDVVADLQWPPGNVAVSPEGRVFFTYHPEAAPPMNVAEVVNGGAVPYPDERFQSEFDTVLSLRIDRQNRLWTLDAANHGFGQPRLIAFDLATERVVYDYALPRDIAGFGSHMNDFQVDPEGERIYIADASILALTPAIVVVDLERRSARRLLEGHPSVVPEPYVPVVQGRPMVVLGIFAVRPGVDSIALDKRGEWLYFAPVTSNHMYRVRTRDLNDRSLGEEDLASRVEAFALKTMSDGITMDVEDNLYLSDLEHSAVVRLDARGGLQTLIQSPRLRWPDGFSFGPEGWLYVTCSSLHHVIGRGAANVRANGPYQIFRFRPGALGVPGH